MTITLPLHTGQEGRETRDRLELLTALIEGPVFDPLLHNNIIDVPRDHPVLHWNCLVPECPAQIRAQELCRRHVKQWVELEAAGMERLEFLRTTGPMENTQSWLLPVRPCLVPACARPAQRGVAAALCTRHLTRWGQTNGSIGVDDPAVLTAWIEGEKPWASHGDCVAVSCTDLARSPLELCEFHEREYRSDDRPGQASLATNWGRWHDHERGGPVATTYQNKLAFRRWCQKVRPAPRAGRLSLFGLHPLVKAELKWALFSYTQRNDHTRWWMHSIQRVLTACRGLRSLEEFDLDTCGAHERMIVGEMLQDLQSVYVTPSDTRAAGYLDLTHFGRKISRLTTKLDLNLLPQRWLRDVFWDYLAEQLRSVNCPRGRSYFYGVRLAGQELGAFLEAMAPDGGHDPAVLTEAVVGQFVADQRRRARDRLPSIRASYNTKPPIVTEVTRKSTFDVLRKVFRWALESGRTEDIGLDRAVVWALPAGGRIPQRTRSPFSDDTAQALADPANLEVLAAADTTDRGARDIWETITATGRRGGEVLELRLDCIAIHNGIPRLWHDQTKVENYNEAIRIPERVYRRLDERRTKTLANFERRYGRRPTAEERPHMALFPRKYKNPRGEHAVTHPWFSRLFREWVGELELGAAVPHQARHTLATKLLAAGASLHHIKKFLGHVSERMSEHYAKVALSEIDDVLHHVWVAGPGAARPGKLLSEGVTPLPPEQAHALALDLGRRSTPTEGGICTFQVVVDGGACPWKLDCENCEKFVMTGADLLYWRRKREQWYSLAERAPDDATADWLHQVFAPTAHAIDGLERALAGLGLLEDALNLDIRRPQDYFHRLWNTGFRTSDLAAVGAQQESA